MANKLFLSLITASAFALLPSCGDDDNGDDPSPAGGRATSGGSGNVGGGGRTGGTSSGGATTGGTNGGAAGEGTGGVTEGGVFNGGGGDDAGAGGLAGGASGEGGEGPGGEGGLVNGGAGGSGGAPGGAGGVGGVPGAGGDEATAGAGGDEATAGAGGDEATAGAGGAEGGAAALMDAEILHVTTTANQGEIEQGTIALDRAIDDDIESFAAMMVSEHGAALATGSELAQELGLANNPVSAELQSQSAAIIAQLQTADDEDFDAVYVNAQVQVHQAVLALLEDELIPSADDPDLQDYLETLRDSVAEHLEAAETLAEGLP